MGWNDLEHGKWAVEYDCYYVIIPNTSLTMYRKTDTEKGCYKKYAL